VPRLATLSLHSWMQLCSAGFEALRLSPSFRAIAGFAATPTFSIFHFTARYGRSYPLFANFRDATFRPLHGACF